MKKISKHFDTKIERENSGQNSEYLELLRGATRKFQLWKVEIVAILGLTIDRI